jgi:hypothetical protein
MLFAPGQYFFVSAGVLVASSFFFVLVLEAYHVLFTLA